MSLDTSVPALGSQGKKPRKSKSGKATAEQESLAEVDEAKQALKAAAKAERAGIVEQQDSAYWFSVYFATRAQRDAFLSALGAAGLLEDDQHINGRRLAERLGVSIGESPRVRSFRADTKLSDLSLPKGGE